MRFILTSLAFLVLLGSGTSVSGQDWAQKMFTAGTSHDFGTVARGAKVEHRFVFTNLYKETLHITEVRSSCGCTKPVVTKREVKSRESAEIIAVYNTTSFLGSRSAVITVTFGDPFPAQLQLRVKGYIRSDVVLAPGKVNFGRVAKGKPSEQRITVSYAGRETWEIVDVRTANTNLEAELHETHRGGGRVEYQLLIRLLGEAPVGFLNDQLAIITNDTRLSRIPLDVEGKVEAEVTVSPSPLVFGTLKPGEKVTKKIVVRAQRPFRILGVVCDGCFKVETTDAARKYHLIPVTFEAGPQGKINSKIHIKTDLGEGAVPDVPAYATVEDGA